MKICPKCGHKYDDSWKICLHCNINLEEDNGQYNGYAFNKVKEINTPLILVAFLICIVNFPMLPVSMVSIAVNSDVGILVEKVGLALLLCGVIFIYANKFFRLPIAFAKIFFVISIITLTIYPVFPIVSHLRDVLGTVGNGEGAIFLDIMPQHSISYNGKIADMIIVCILAVLSFFNFYLGKLIVKRIK